MTAQATPAPLLLLIAVLLAAPAPAQLIGDSGVTELVTHDESGLPLTMDGHWPSVSEDGRHVAFQTAEGLVASDTNGFQDVYVIDRETGQVTCASTSATGQHGNGHSYNASISADGRYVAFESLASNLKSLDGNLAIDVFRKDLQTGAIVRVSDAWLSAFAANGTSRAPSISDDGQRVCFESDADDLIALDTNLTWDVFVRDLQTGQTERASEGVWGQANGASGGGRISGDGTHVAYRSAASNLVLFDSNGFKDVFVVELGKNPVLASQTPAGGPGSSWSQNPRISVDGSTVLFESLADDLSPLDMNATTDVFRFDLASKTVELVSLSSAQVQVGDDVTLHALSRDGRVVVLGSTEPLAPNSIYDYSVYVRDLELGQTVTGSRPSGTVTLANGQSGEAALAQGGTLVFFASLATNMAPGDVNGVVDLFVRTLHADPFEYCSSSATSQGCLPRLTPFGFSSASGETELTIVGDELPNQKTGILFYGFEGPAANPWGGATMCIQGSKKRSPLMSTTGNLMGDDCSGFFSFDMDTFAAGGLGGSPKPELSVVGQRVNVQFWGRDPVSATGTFLSTAVEYVVGP